MCAIAGFCNMSMNYTEEPGRWYNVLERMNHLLKHRGPDDDNLCLFPQVGLAHTRLSIIDPQNGKQPMTRQLWDHKATLVFNGEIYNMPSLRQELENAGIEFSTSADTEVLLMGYLKYGISYLQKLNGIFAFGLWDESRKELYLVRDRLGVKPLFYSFIGNTIIFSSEIKGILAFPEMKAIVDREGLCEVLALGPAKTPGSGVFRNIQEVKPGRYLCFGKTSKDQTIYWKLEGKPHEEAWEQTVEHTRFLLEDAIRLQMLSDVPICTFLSGGVDSSIVTSVCSKVLEKQGKVLDTYSFDFKDNHLYFKANSFQPSEDRPFVDCMVHFCNTNHTYLECTNYDLYEDLFRAVDARDLPCMADVEASMLHFCRLVAKKNKVALTGECADEIFGGYPWFHKKESLQATTFPWSTDFTPRTGLLKEELAALLPLEDYAKNAYARTIRETPLLAGENPLDKRRREISYLNLQWFMQTLLDRMDRTAMQAGLEARVPFADHRIVEYLYNVPWNMKCKNGVVKGLLREAAKDLLPSEILNRKKSPYPKTYDPAYENLLKTELLAVLEDSSSPLSELIDRQKVMNYLKTPSDYGKPFYGQLMAGPQLLAYLLQINYWLKTYSITLLL